MTTADTRSHWHTAGLLVGAAVVLVLALWALGWPLVNSDLFAAVRAQDVAASMRVLEMRTPELNNLSGYGSSLSDTFACIGVLVVMMTVLRLWLGRWRESLVLLVAIGGELVFFLAVTGVIARDRPAIAHLDPAPPTSSYPSGHTAAAVALYGCLAIIVLRQLRPAWLAVTLATVLWCIPAIVGMSRIYRGMHHMSDVIVGAVAGGIWLAIVIAVLYPPPRPSPAPRAPDRGTVRIVSDPSKVTT